MGLRPLTFSHFSATITAPDKVPEAACYPNPSSGSGSANSRSGSSPPPPRIPPTTSRRTSRRRIPKAPSSSPQISRPEAAAGRASPSPPRRAGSISPSSFRWAAGRRRRSWASPPRQPWRSRAQSTHAPDAAPLVVGVGVNLCSAPKIPDAPFPPVSLADAGFRAEPEALAASIAAGLCGIASHGFSFAPYADEYRARSIVLGRRIAFTENGVAEDGEVRAIGDDGALVVMTARGVRRLSSGEISVRPV